MSAISRFYENRGGDPCDGSCKADLAVVSVKEPLVAIRNGTDAAAKGSGATTPLWPRPAWYEVKASDMNSPYRGLGSSWRRASRTPRQAADSASWITKCSGRAHTSDFETPFCRLEHFKTLGLIIDHSGRALEGLGGCSFVFSFLILGSIVSNAQPSRL